MKKLISLLIVLTILVGCGSKEKGSDLKGSIAIDGSSTVAPISEAIIEEYTKENSGVQISMGISGTGGGFKKFTTNETAISNASRPIKDEEKAIATENKIEYYELLIAKDALSVVVHKDNTWAKDLSVEQLKLIWSAGSEKIMWSDLDSSWPKEKIKLYGPGTDSGTYDYFNEEIIGEDAKMRTDYTASEDDNVLVTGVSGDKNALAFFGFVYYLENEDKLGVVKIDGVEPSVETVNDGSYTPLSRPLYIYINKDKYQNDKALKSFVDYYLDNVKDIALEVGYFSITDDELAESKSLLK